jgi:hypothetical protein
MKDSRLGEIGAEIRLLRRLFLEKRIATMLPDLKRLTFEVQASREIEEAKNDPAFRGFLEKLTSL